jgi:trimeric autotransporter adhesin
MRPWLIFSSFGYSGLIRHPSFGFRRCDEHILISQVSEIFPRLQPMKTTATILLSIILTLVGIGFLPEVQAVSPPPDGGYPGGNTAEGQNALLSLSTGTYNTAVGLFSLTSNTEGKFNTATGAGTLLANTADENTATGAGALLSNTTGDRNTANGAFVLFNNTTGNSNTSEGWRALFQNTTGARNTASGRETLISNTTGFENTATGAVALQNNTTGNDNTATGFAALNSNTTGALNTATGTGALVNSTGDLNIASGFGAGAYLATGNNNIDIGNVGVAAEGNTIRIGTEVAIMDPFGVLHPAHTATYIAGIRDADAVGGEAVFVTTDGKLGTVSVPSSARFKEEIKPMNKASEAILALNPVTFCYKKELDSKGMPQFGLVAEEVEKVAPDLVKRDRAGKLQTVRYDAVNAMLLNEFLKEHRQVEQMEATIARQQEQIEALTAGLEKVNAQLEANKATPRVVAR